MRAIVRQAESLSASPGFLSAIPTTSLLRMPQKHPTFRGDTRMHPACSRIFTATTSPPPRRGKAMTKNGEENKHSDSPNLVDDTQTVGPSTYRWREHRIWRTIVNTQMDPFMGRLFRSIVRSDPNLMEFNGGERFAEHCFYAFQSF